MLNLFLRFVIVFVIYHSGNVSATHECDENDLQTSKRAALISGVPYEDLNRDRKGVMTLCFRKQEGTYDHTSLVFEMFTPTTSPEISLKMIHYGQEDDCCGFGGKKRIMIDGHADTLKKVHRAIEVSNVTGDKKFVPAKYTRYASWIVLNEQLVKGLVQAEEDQKHDNSYNCVKYVAKIMRTVGLNNVDFGWWSTKPENLKLLVDSHIQPKPDRTTANLPQY